MGEIDLAALPRLGPDRHVLDETQFQAVFPCVVGQRHDVGVRDAANADGVDLDGMKARLPSGGDAAQHPFQAVAAGDLAEALRVERVQADVDAAQAGVEQGLGVLGQEQAVGGQAHVADAGNPDEHPHQPRQVAAHQRLAAGETDFVDPQWRGDADEVGDLLEGEQLGPVHEHDLLRHAVDAAEVAAVGDADAQVVVDAAERVHKWGVRSGE